ncbi:MAG: YafY family transcriptional regulator [Proteobacteria bacterium]|nr:YafY family transcriptional regulator [Pseudomonadota bacterium]
MRRADRLFELVQLIRGRRLSTAAWLAARLEVSERTVYRDVADLMAQGVPIDGEAGVGYRMRAGFDLPPLMFTQDEARALVAAIRIAQPRLDSGLAPQAERALSKILAVLPPAVRAAAESLALFAPGAPADLATRDRLAVLREAIEQRRKLRVRYRDLADSESTRVLRPLACLYWDANWTLAAWCELRQDFRSFRVDRLLDLQVLDKRFRDESGRSLTDLLRQHQVET